MSPFLFAWVQAVSQSEGGTKTRSGSARVMGCRSNFRVLRVRVIQRRQENLPWLSSTCFQSLEVRVFLLETLNLTYRAGPTCSCKHGTLTSAYLVLPGLK